MDWITPLLVFGPIVLVLGVILLAAYLFIEFDNLFVRALGLMLVLGLFYCITVVAYNSILGG